MTSDFPSASARAQELFAQTLRAVFDVVTKVFLPHLACGVGLFLLTGFALYQTVLVPLNLPAWVQGLAGVLIVAVYGGFAFLYAFFTACVFAVHAASVRVEEFVESVFALIKANVESKINNMDEGLAKEQAKVIMKNSVSEVYALFKTYKLKSFPALAAWVFLGVMTFVTKTVFVARVMRLSGRAVQMSAVFAGRATLVGAVFLNLRVLSAAALWGLYGLAAGIIGLNFWFILK